MSAHESLKGGLELSLAGRVEAWKQHGEVVLQSALLIHPRHFDDPLDFA